MNERNVLAGTTATLLSPFIDGWQNLLIWLILSLVLIIGDLRFGISAAKKRGETTRPIPERMHNWRLAIPILIPHLENLFGTKGIVHGLMQAELRCKYI